VGRAARRGREIRGHHLYVVLFNEGRQTEPSHVRYGLSHGVPTFRMSWAGGAHTSTTLAVTQGDGRDMSRPYITQHHPTRFRGRGWRVRWPKYGDTICTRLCSRRADKLTRAMPGTAFPMVSPHFAVGGLRVGTPPPAYGTVSNRPAGVGRHAQWMTMTGGLDGEDTTSSRPP
jgi:hypothetical protein